MALTLFQRSVCCHSKIFGITLRDMRRGGAGLFLKKKRGVGIIIIVQCRIILEKYSIKKNPSVLSYLFLFYITRTGDCVI